MPAEHAVSDTAARAEQIKLRPLIASTPVVASHPIERSLPHELEAKSTFQTFGGRVG